MKRECNYCGKEYEAKTSSKYCDIKCRQQDYRVKRIIREATPEFKQKRKKYQENEKYKSNRRRWAKETRYMNDYMKKWRKDNHEHWIQYKRNRYDSEKNSIKCRKYRQTENGKIASKKKKAKRKRNLKFQHLWKNPFPKNIPVDYHHINNILTIPIPKQTHQYICGVKKQEHQQYNYRMIEKLYQIDLQKILK